ncbi:hypothetical protein FIA58_003430 [Flavobacterium jejuense]|uniref:Uncharacterized protein n=1 Tax=Flavobacterium jejuense TaxID=1544455 RepID=A0ABX0IQG5_9FLAO|nr:hypothetical protein [Flavobacterium jejuense]NHN24718.1 hypothetical protein [Flavobacterium jejuense]
MKTILLLFVLLLNTICAAQKEETFSKSEKEYFELLNYTPIQFNNDLENKWHNKIVKTDLNSIWKLKNAFNLYDLLNLNERQWLEEQVKRLALSFFLEKKPIILNTINLNYDNAKLIMRELKKEIIITTLNFDESGCFKNHHSENFIRIFNHQTEKLISKK